MSATESVHGRELWVSNGAATGLVEDFNAGSADSTSVVLGMVGNKAIFRVTAPGKNGIWALDLTTFSMLDSSAPTVSGVARVGRTLSAGTTGWEAGTSFAYAWLRDGVEISGATGPSYSLRASDLGRSVSVRVIGSKLDSTTKIEHSSAVVVTAGIQTLQPKPKVKGKAKVGRKLRAKPGAHDAGVTLTYQWLRNGKKIKGKGGKKKAYVVKRADKGRRPSVKVSAKKPSYATVVRTSKKTAKVG